MIVYNRRRNAIANRVRISRNAGYSFGRAYYSFKPNLTHEQLLRITSTLRIVKNDFDVVSYREGFIAGYSAVALENGIPVLREYDENGNRLPMKDERSVQKMGKLAKVKQETSNQHPFVKVADLYEFAAIVCIKHIRRTTGKFGDQWNITALLENEVANQIPSEKEIPLDNLVTFSVMADNDQRNEMLEELKKIVPIHGVTLQKIKTRSGNDFIDFDEADECPCGSDVDSEDVEVLDDSEFADEEFEELEETPPPPPTPTPRQTRQTRQAVPPVQAEPVAPTRQGRTSRSQNAETSNGTTAKTTTRRVSTNQTSNVRSRNK